MNANQSPDDQTIALHRTSALSPIVPTTAPPRASGTYPPAVVSPLPRARNTFPDMPPAPAAPRILISDDQAGTSSSSPTDVRRLEAEIAEADRLLSPEGEQELKAMT